MKLRAKFFVIFCLLVCVVSAFAGCAAKEKNFEAKGFAITLTDAFTKKENSKYAAYFESSKAIVTAERIDFLMFESSGYSSDISLQEYAEMVISGNKLTATVQEKEGLVCFTYEKTVDGSEFTYFAVVFRGADAYWLVHFACATSNFSAQEAQFILWAKTVEV